ncbi:MAG: plastocyanin/azurin family copper-binding protein [Gemmatimonadales bacterium]
MRAKILLAGLAVFAAACGGEKKADQQAATQGDQMAPAATTPAATGTVHDVNMVLEGSTYKYVPNMLTIKPGDQIRFHNVSGGPHNVEFYPDSIPAGAAAVLNAGMPDRTSDLAGPLLVEPNATYTVSFAGAPTGEYHFFCLPHQALGMVGKITVAQ